MTPAPFETFRLMCWANSYLVSCGHKSLSEAADRLQDFAEANGVVDELGQDCVQEVMAAELRCAHVDA